MKRKIILNIAMSLDGYIATEDGLYEWIHGDGNKKNDTEKKWKYEDFLENIDTVVMGKNCYDQKMQNDFKSKKVIVATSQNIDDYENIFFVKDPCGYIMEEELKKEGKDIYLFGGGILVSEFIKNDIIDEYIIGIIPTILGNGKRLFIEENKPINLKLEEYIVDEGIVILKYKK